MHNKISTITLVIICLFFYTTKYTQAQNIVDRLAGQIILQIESMGEAWYVDPISKTRYYLGKPTDAFKVMRKMGLGISNENLRKIPIGLSENSGHDFDKDGLSDALEESIGTNILSTDSDGDGHRDNTEIYNHFNPKGKGRLPIDNILINKIKGRILLQVEKNGEAWYLNPKDRKRYFLGNPNDAHNIMKKIGLGVSNADLVEIPEPPQIAENTSNTLNKKGEIIKEEKKEEEIIKLKKLNISPKIAKANSKVFKKQTGSLLALFEINNPNKETITLENIQTNLIRNNQAPKISNPIHFINYDTGKIIGETDGSGFNDLNSTKISSTTIKQNKKIRIAIVTNLLSNIRDDSSYQTILERIFYSIDNKQITEKTNIKSNVFSTNQTNIIVFSKADNKSLEYTVGQIDTELALFNFEAIGNEKILINEIIIESSKILKSNDFKKIYVYINNKKFDEISNPTGKLFTFNNKGFKLYPNKTHTIKLKGDSKTTLNVNSLRFLISNINAISEKQKIPTHFTNEQESRSTNVNFNKASATITTGRETSTIYTDSTENTLTSFYIKNDGNEDIQLSNLKIITTGNLLSFNSGYSNLKLERKDGTKIGKTISRPLSINNTISLNKYIIPAKTEYIFNLVCDLNKDTPEDTNRLKIKTITATGNKSKVNIPIKFKNNIWTSVETTSN